MRVAIPMRVEEITGHKASLSAMGVRMEADISLVEGVATGDYVLVHAGFAIAKVEPEDAQETLGFSRRLNSLP